MEDTQAAMQAIQAEVAKQLMRNPNSDVYQMLASLYSSKNESVGRVLARTVSAEEEANYVGLVMQKVKDGGLVVVSGGRTKTSN